MSFLKVLSNLSHNGTFHAAGTFIEAELEEFAHLVADGVLRVVEAESIGEAENAVEPTPEPEAVAQNTWEAAPDAPDSVEAPVVEAPVEEVVEEKTETETAPESASDEEDLGDNL